MYKIWASNAFINPPQMQPRHNAQSQKHQGAPPPPTRLGRQRAANGSYRLHHDALVVPVVLDLAGSDIGAAPGRTVVAVATALAVESLQRARRGGAAGRDRDRDRVGDRDSLG